MSRVLILFATVDGQTARIAERMAGVLRAEGHEVVLLPADDPGAPGEIERSERIIIGSSIRYGHHPRYLRNLVSERRSRIALKSGAFFSVCLSAGGPGAKPETARAYLESFLERTGWHPALSASFAGALLYRRYNPFIRWLVRMFVAFAGGDTDTSRDYEYTDWDAVDRFAREFAHQR